MFLQCHLEYICLSKYVNSFNTINKLINFTSFVKKIVYFEQCKYTYFKWIFKMYSNIGHWNNQHMRKCVCVCFNYIFYIIQLATLFFEIFRKHANFNLKYLLSYIHVKDFDNKYNYLA